MTIVHLALAADGLVLAHFARSTDAAAFCGYPDLSVFPAQRQSRDTRERNRILLLRAPACHEILKPDLTVGATEHGALL